MMVRHWRKWSFKTQASVSLPLGLPFNFQPFHRGTNASSRATGAGLGLAGARAVVERHGGTISIASQEGIGTSVTVNLPLVAPE